MKATWTKLKSGEWGVRAEGPVRDGAVLTVTKKSGGVSRVVVKKVVWSGNGVSLCAVSSDTDSVGNRIGNGESYRAGVTAPRGRVCPQCGSRECAKAWDYRDLCDDD